MPKRQTNGRLPAPQAAVLPASSSTRRRFPHALRFSLALLLLSAHASFASTHVGDRSAAASSAPRRLTPGRQTGAQPAAPQSDGFDAERAFAHVRKMVEMGARPAGSPELSRARAYITDELKSYGLKVSTDEFSARTPLGKRQMVNLTATLEGESAECIIVASHYDTKFFKDFHFVGANDGASSTGVLMELARVLASAPHKPRFTYWFVFFDGEEAFCRDWDECGKPDAPDNTYGSRRFVAQLKKRDELKRVRAMILLDMIGYKKLELGRDSSSTGWLLDAIWQTARSLGHGAQFLERAEGVGGDDHEPFLQAGVDAVDLIQLGSYPYWHTPDDTLDKISPQSLKIVGDVVLASLPRIEEHLSGRRPQSSPR